MKPYRMPFEYGEIEFEEKKSRFIGHVWPVTTEDEALAHIKEMREKYWDATHNVYAYIIKDSGISRYSDDGEPQGTSGMPTLNVFQKEEITNVCCVITRYFGGTLLGTGGLTRAYSHTAKLTLDTAGVSEMKEWDIFGLSVAYNMYEKVRQEIADAGGLVENSEFADIVKIDAALPAEMSDYFKEKITDISAGKIVCEKKYSKFMGKKQEK